MNERCGQISLSEWESRYESLQQEVSFDYPYAGSLGRHVRDGDRRLLKLRFDDSPAALRLWNFLLTENERLRKSRESGKKIVGTMKDLGTVPVMAYSLDNVVAFYPDGAWWTPCVMEMSAGLLDVADSLGIDESFCPVRAMLGAFITKDQFPLPDLLTCSVGATCDDFSAIAQRLEGLGHEILWWEIPHRREPDVKEEKVKLPGGFFAAKSQVDFVKGELEKIKDALAELSGQDLDDEKLMAGIKKANEVRALLAEIRGLVFTSMGCPMGALEMLIAEMLAIHFCSDRDETILVLRDLLEEIRRRVANDESVVAADAVKVFWVNPVADLRLMNMLEDRGGRICGTEYLFSHALDGIPEDVEPLEALAMTALADPMAGSNTGRAKRICNDIRLFGSEAVVISRIPGASHCALEGKVIGNIVKRELKMPVLEIEVPPLSDSIEATLRTRLEALVEVVKDRRRK